MRYHRLREFLCDLKSHLVSIFLIKNLIAAYVISFATPEEQLSVSSQAVRLFRKYFVGVDGYAPVQSIFGGDGTTGYTLTFASENRFNQNILFTQGYFTLYRPIFHFPLKTSINLGLPGTGGIIQALYVATPNEIVLQNVPQSVIDQLLSVGDPSSSFITQISPGVYQLIKDATIYCYN